MSAKKGLANKHSDPVSDMKEQQNLACAKFLHSDALPAMLGWALSLHDLFRLSLVCRRWSRAARSAECWAGHQINISHMSASVEDLQRWLPIWRLSEFVLLNYSQLDGFARPCPSWHLIWHNWGRWQAEVFDNWHDTRLGSMRCLAMMTEQRVPNYVGIQFSWRSLRLKTSILFGWTTAASPKVLSRLWSSRNHGASRLDGELITVRLSQQGLRNALRACETQPDEVLEVVLHRESGSVGLRTFANGIITLRQNPHQPVSPCRRLRFFLAVPRPVGRAVGGIPRVSLRPSDCSTLDL